MGSEGNEHVVYSNCSNLSAHSLQVLALLRGLTGAVCFTVCIAALLLVLNKKCLRSLWEKTEARLMAYLLLSTAAYLLVLSCHMEHYWNGTEERRRERHWVSLCVALGTADQYTGTVQLFFTCGIAAHFIYCSWQLFYKKRYAPDHNLPTARDKALQRGFEVLLVVVSLAVPMLYVWVPFVAVPYGEAGPWCWIQTLGQGCLELKTAFWEQMGMWYIPFGVGAAFSFTSIAAFLAALCYQFQYLKKRKEQKKGEAILLMASLLSYCLLFLIECASRVIDSKVKKDYFVVWLLYAVSTPLSGIILPIGLLLYTHTGTLRDVATQYCHCRCIRQNKTFVSLFRNPSSFTSEPTHIRTSDHPRGLVDSRRVEVELEQSCDYRRVPAETTPLLAAHVEEVIPLEQ